MDQRPALKWPLSGNFVTREEGALFSEILLEKLLGKGSDWPSLGHKSHPRVQAGVAGSTRESERVGLEWGPCQN